MTRRKLEPCSREMILKLGFFLRGAVEPGVVYSICGRGFVRRCFENREGKIVSWVRGQTGYRDIGLIAEPVYSF